MLYKGERQKGKYYLEDALSSQTGDGFTLMFYKVLKHVIFLAFLAGSLPPLAPLSFWLLKKKERTVAFSVSTSVSNAATIFSTTFYKSALIYKLLSSLW